MSKSGKHFDLFAAYQVATGKVMVRHEKRRRRKELLAFMDEVVAAYPGRRLEVILDNLNTHKKNEQWLARHPLVTFHYTPTRASLRIPAHPATFAAAPLDEFVDVSDVRFRQAVRVL